MSEADSLEAMSRTAAASIAGILFLTLGAVAQGQVTVASISPNSGTISGGTSVQMNGTNFQSGAAVTFGSTPATSVTVVNSTTITATTPSHAVGAVNVTVTNPGGQSATLFASQAPLTNAGFESGSGSWAANGTGTATVVTSNPGSAHSGNNYLQITVSPPSNQLSFMALLNGTSQYLPVTPGDVITFGGWASRTSGDGKARWAIEASDSTKANAIYLAATPANVTSAPWQNQQGTYTVPTGIAFIRFYCQITGNTVQSQANFDDATLQRSIAGGGFTYTSSPAPTFTSISPASGPAVGGTSVTLTGTNFQSGATVKFGSTFASNVSVVNSTTITALTPANSAGPVNVMVTNPGGQSATLFASQAPLTNPGFESGSNSWAANGSGTATVITNSPGAAHSGNNYAQITVTPPSTQLSFMALLNGTSQYLAVAAGDVVTFGGWASRTSGDGKARWGIEATDSNKANPVYLSAVPANVTTSAWLNQQATYTVPVGKAFIRFYCQITGNTVQSQAKFDDAMLQRSIAGGGFTYTGGPAPTLSSIAPATGPTAGGTPVTLTGTNFLSGATVTFDSTAATNVSVVSSTKITATTPAHTSGSASVVVTNPDSQTAVKTNGFTFTNSAPAVTSITPSSGTSNGGTSVNIRGSNFQAGATVTIGGSPVTNVTVVNSGSINGVTPAHAAGASDVVVTNPDSQAATLAATLHNQGLESGSAEWVFTGPGTGTIGSTVASAHIGTRYIQLSSAAGNHPVYYAASGTTPRYFPVTPGDVITFGGWAYRVSGDGLARWAIEVSDANKANPTFLAAPPTNVQVPQWQLQQGTYTVPAGAAFIRLYAEIVSNTQAAVARFDDAIFQRSPGGTSGFTFISPPIVTSVAPNWGAPQGGTTRTVYGTGFLSGATVTVGGIAASHVVVNSNNAIAFFAPTHSAGATDITVTNPGGDTSTLANSYTYRVPPAPPAGLTNVGHIIFTFQENRSFDNYFGVMNQYRTSQGVNDNAVDGLPLNQALLDISGNPVKPFHFQTECHENTQPSWNASHVDYDNGLMDNFMKTGNFFTSPSTLDPNGTRTMGYYDWTDLPYYYSLAFQFATSDRFFSSLMGPTGANRAYSFAGTSLGFVSDPQPPSGGLPNLTIFDLLDQAGISWRYYFQNATPEWITAWSVYNTDSNKVVPMSAYFDDIKNEATFPQVVFIEENGNLDEHPKPNPGTNTPGQNIQNGAKNMAAIIGSLMASPSWKSSVFILAYDEGGGMRDHVVPPNMTQPDGYPPAITSTDQPGIFNQAGFRVPFVVVSPWTGPHLVSHINRDHTSILKLIETRFSLPPLTARDDAADNMTEFFNFQSPSWMTPPTLPVQPTNGVCDLALEKAPGQ